MYLLAYGSNEYGELCVPRGKSGVTPVKKFLYRSHKCVKQVQVADHVTLVLYDDGSIVASGSNLNGAMQMKYNNTENVEVELPMLSNEKVVQIGSFWGWMLISRRYPIQFRDSRSHGKRQAVRMGQQRVFNALSKDW